MAVATPPHRQSPVNEMDVDRDSAIGDTVVVKSTSSTDSDASSMRSSPDENLETPTSQTHSSVYPNSNGNDSSHKRKRSHIEDAGRSSPRQYDYSPPKRPEHPQHMAERAMHVLGTDEQQYYGHQNGHTWDQDQAQPVQPPNGEDQWESPNGQGYDPTMNGSNGILPKRKRNFSNRTKTGCMTCRRRKKKCGEERPQCQNCIRGGFPCEGYSTARTTGLWPKPTTIKPPVPLQSKNGHPETYEPSHRTNGSPVSARPYDVPPSRAVSMHDPDRPHRYAAAPSNEPRSQPPYPGQTWPQQQSQPPYTKDHLPPLTEINRPDVPPPREMSRPPTQGSGGHPPTSQAPPPQHSATSQPPPQYPIQPTSHQSTPHPYYSPSEYRPYPPPPPPADYRGSPPVSHSRMSSAGYDHHKSGAKTFTVEEVERSRMLRNSRYSHFDPTLENDRRRCERAVARYNAASMIDSGMDAEECRTMLWKVFDPARDTTHKFDAPPREKGTLSHGVRIEAPFTCLYGYNMKVMDNVYIGKGANIDDAGKVEIGARTWIGPNVTILTSDCIKDMVDRKGAAGAWIARNVYIESEVVIGANAMIYPGVRLGRGSTVEPGAIVREPLGDNQVQRADGKRDFM